MKNLILTILTVAAILVSCNENKNPPESKVEQNLPESNAISKQQEEELISSLASTFHEAWRKPRLLEDGTYQPRLKTTTDQQWISIHKTDQVDIANTSFNNLPSDWQEENTAAATVAMNEVLSAYRDGVALDSTFIEKASEKVHTAWLERNSEWAQEDQKLPYAQLSEVEKDKDRVQVKAAIEVLRENV